MHLEFHIAIVLAMVTEWEDAGVYITQTVWPMPPLEVYWRPCLAKKSLELFWWNIQIQIQLPDMNFSKLEDISKFEGQKPKINIEGESTLPARIQKPPNGALNILTLSASLLAS